MVLPNSVAYPNSDLLYESISKKDVLSVEEDIYKSTIPSKTLEEPVVVPEFRQIPKNFLLKYTSPYTDIGFEYEILSREKEKLFLKIIFVGLIMVTYVLFF